MSRRLLRSVLAVAALTVAAGCDRGEKSEPIPPGLPGTYVYAAKGSTLKFPWEFSAALHLKQDGRYSLVVDKTISGEKDPPETTAGAYGVRAGRLWIRGGEEDPGSAPGDEAGLLIRGDSLIGEIGWSARIILKGIGAPQMVFVRDPSSASGETVAR